MFCMKCGSQTENTNGVCDNCKKEADLIPVAPVISHDSTKKSSMIRFTKDQFIHAGIITVSTMIISFILSAVVAIIINLAAKNYITMVMNKYTSGLLSMDSLASISPYMIWRMSFLNSFVMRAGMGDITLSARYIILILIPALSFFISWKLVKKSTIREKLPNLFKETQLHLDFKKYMEITLFITGFYTIIFVLTSLIPITLFKQDLGFLDTTFKVSYHFTLLSALLGTSSVVFITNIFLGLYYKFISLNQIDAHPNVQFFLHIYKRYFFNSAIITVGLLLVTLFRNNLWKQIVILVTALPNLVLITMNALVGGLKISSSDGTAFPLFQGLSSQGKFAYVCLLLIFILLTIIAFIQVFQNIAKDNVKKYWINVSIVTGYVVVSQVIVYILASIHISIWEAGEIMRMSITSNLFILILVLVAIGAISGAAVFYLPENLLKLVHLTENQKNTDKPNRITENMELIILGGLFLFTIIIGIIGNSNGSIRTSNNYEETNLLGTTNDSINNKSLSLLDPDNIQVYNNGYIFFENGNYHLYKNNKLSIIRIHNTKEAIYDEFTFSPTEDRILVDSGSKLRVMNGKGNDISKQEVTYDELLAVSEDFNYILFSYDGEITLYNCKNNEFTVLELTRTTDSFHNFTYFDTKSENIYFVGDNIIAYNIKTQKEVVLYEDSPETIILDKIYVIKGNSTVPEALEDGSALSYGYKYDEYSGNYSIVTYTDEGTKVILSNISEFIDFDNNKFVFTFDNSSDTYVYNANSDQLYNITSEIRYLSMNSKIKGGK